MLKTISIIILIIPLFSCIKSEISRNKNGSIGQNNNSQSKIIDSENINRILVSNNNEIELLNDDYIVIDLSETERTFMVGYDPSEAKFIYEERIQINLTIEVINYEKIDQINNLINPVIYLEMNNRLFLARGMNTLSSSFPRDCDYFFSIHPNLKIAYFENGIIRFTGFKDN
jgi:hypothetical protein